MSSHRFRRNYSQNDIRQLINESQKKADYINRIIDGDIHFNMMTESYSPLKEKLKYIKSNYNVNNKNYIPPHSQRIVLNNFNSKNNPPFPQNKNLKISENNLNNNYYIKNNNHINNNNLYNSLDLNKPFHREKKHFPLINNKGNFFKNENLHLIKRNFINNKSNFENNYRKIINNKYGDRYNPYPQFQKKELKSYDEEKGNDYRNINLRRSSSMVNIPNNFPRIHIKNKLIDNNKRHQENNSQDEEINPNSRNEKHYSPRRYDYEGSRYGDNTYNYYLNEPMRGDISADWKFPPLYCYNSQIDYGKSFPDY